MIGRILPSFLDAVNTLEVKSFCGVFTSLIIPLSWKSDTNGRMSSRFFPLIARRSSGISDRGGEELKLSLRPDVIMLVTVGSPSFAHWDSRSLSFNSQVSWSSGSFERTPGSEKNSVYLCNFGLVK